MNRRINPGGLLIAGGGVFVLLLLAIGWMTGVVPQVAQEMGITPSPSASPSPSPSPSPVAETCIDEVHIFYYDDGKISPNNFGPPVQTDELEAVQAEQRRTRCQDPYITASHMAGVGWIRNTAQSIEETANRYKSDHEAWQQAIDRLERWERSAEASIERLPNEYWSFYMRPGDDRQSVHVYQDNVVHGTGKMLVYEQGDTRVMRRLECRFQPVNERRFPEQVPPVPEDHPPGHPPGSPPDEPPGTPPETPPGTPPETPPGDDSKSDNPDDYRYPDGKPPAEPVTEPADPAPPPVDTEDDPPAQPPPVNPGGSTDPDPVDPGDDDNHGTVPTAPPPGQPCNPDFHQCP